MELSKNIILARSTISHGPPLLTFDPQTLNNAIETRERRSKGHVRPPSGLNKSRGSPCSSGGGPGIPSDPSPPRSPPSGQTPCGSAAAPAGPAGAACAAATARCSGPPSSGPGSPSGRTHPAWPGSGPPASQITGSRSPPGPAPGRTGRPAGRWVGSGSGQKGTAAKEAIKIGIF